MPGFNGLEVTARLARECPDVAVLILSIQADADSVRRAFQAGATGYLVKDAGLSVIEHAIRSAARTRPSVSPEPFKRLVVDHKRPAGAAPDPLAQLTSQQREVLRLIAAGYSTKDIARLLWCNVKTVETHRAHLMNQLKIYDMPGLVCFAIRAGLISAADPPASTSGRDR